MKNGELKKLLKVPTTVKQATQILKRNEALLKVLENGVPNLLKGFAPRGWNLSFIAYKQKIVEIGCPHCVVSDCEYCSWAKYNLKSGYDVEFCQFALFNGHTLEDLAEDNNQYFIALEYKKNYAYLIVYANHLKSQDKHLWTGDEKSETICIIQEEIQDIREFLEGHIEWAKAVIKKGGTK